MNIGDRVEILKQIEMRSGDRPDGKLLARFRPGGIYAVTQGNHDRLKTELEAGAVRMFSGVLATPESDAEPAAAAVKLPASPSRVRGRFSSNKKG